MAIDKLNFFMQAMQGVTGANQSVTPVSPVSQQTSGSDSIFTSAVSASSQSSNPFASQSVSFSGNTQNNSYNGLSQLGEGALGEDALYTKKGRLGKDLNIIA